MSMSTFKMAEIYWERFQEICMENMPLPIIAALVVIMLVPAIFLRWGKLDPFLSPEQWKELALTKKTICNHNTRIFRFDLPYPTMPLGLPLGRHIIIRGKHEDGEEVMKPYTPTTDLLQRGFVEFVIKVYPEGRMSQTMDKLKIGDKLEFRGPRGRFALDLNERRALGMIAGGTGITPMYQVAKALMGDQQEHTSISLIYANVTADDILLKKELDELSQTYARFKVYYVLNTPPEGWSGGTGFVSKAMVKQHMPPPSNDITICRVRCCVQALELCSSPGSWCRGCHL